jgi:predicted metal-dependent phosphoesterase TrpH
MAGRRFDLHVHTRASPDSSLRVEEAIEEALVQGLSGLAITDHNTTKALHRAREVLSDHREFLLIPGQEVSTPEGHLLVYGIEDPLPRDVPVRDLLDQVRDRGGVSVIAHPFRWVHGMGRERASTLPVQGLEAMNGRNAEIANAKAALLAARRGVSATGGSDAHERSGMGRCLTEIPEEVDTVEEVLDCLRKGRTRALGQGRSTWGRMALSLENAAKRLARGLRPV